MSTETERSTAPIPPAGEEIHLPEPSYLPAVLALGITIAIVGIVMNLVVMDRAKKYGSDTYGSREYAKYYSE